MTPTADATELFSQELREAMPHTIRVTGGCDSWYIGPDGTPTIWPWTDARHKELLGHLEPRDWEIREPYTQSTASTGWEKPITICPADNFPIAAPEGEATSATTDHPRGRCRTQHRRAPRIPAPPRTPHSG